MPGFAAAEIWGETIHSCELQTGPPHVAPPRRCQHQEFECQLRILDLDSPIRQLHPSPLPPVVRHTPAVRVLDQRLLSGDLCGAAVHYRLNGRAPGHHNEVIQRTSPPARRC